MPFSIITGDITQIKADAIVNAANRSLLGGGGVDGAIHRAAGPNLLKECRGLGGCKTGEAKITAGYRLPVRYIIHTAGPVWHGGTFGEAELLASCYENSLRLALENGCSSVAFPLISAGAYGYPKEAALRIAEETIGNFLKGLPEDREMNVTLVLFRKSECTIDEALRDALDVFIESEGTENRPLPEQVESIADDFLSKNDISRPIMSASCIVSARISKLRSCISEGLTWKKTPSEKTSRIPDSEKPFADSETPTVSGASIPENEITFSDAPGNCASPSWDTIESALGGIDESFSQMLLRKIRESGMSDPECYRKANIDRKLFSKIRSDIRYKPKKNTALAFAIALELPLEETKSLLEKAGYALSHSSKADLIVEYFIRNGIWDMFRINDALFAYDQVPLGA